MAKVVDVERYSEDNKKQAQELEDEESFSYAVQLGNSVVLPMALKSATDLGVFDVLQKAGSGANLSAKEIASQLSCENPQAPTMLDRLLALLASHSILKCSVLPVPDEKNLGSFQRLYSMAPVAKFFAPDSDGFSLGPLLALLQDKIFLESWSQLKDAIREGGIPFNRVHGTHAFEYPGLDSRFNDVFNSAMINHTTLVMKKVLECYKGFDDIKRLVDVGGGLGININMITSKYPHIQGVNFDLPHVIELAPSYPGVEHVGGDMFASVPKGDAIFMKWILHDWSDEHCLKLLKNCYDAIPDDGKVIVVEAVLPIIPETNAAWKSVSQTDVLMMTQNPGGKERSEQEYMELATAAGFSGIRYECYVRTFWVMEFFK
ncbi:cathecol O-methyltransferase 1-like [Gastrolobium bilobum]|uniref:cathecol O-methyltransferase 1-like n=1 Tax=Gastrolobium bilobum TaxID=150636 RepID=UPI002AB03020|nr:cathecol O-methyltransferase 1-like [Gastrolobium bilobum]